MSDGTSIREVIEGASPAPWATAGAKKYRVCDVWDGHEVWADALNSGDADGASADARFIATFDPEHIALMEAEDAAVAGLIAEMDKGTQRGGKPHMALTALRSCHDRLTTYRTERGYVR